MKRWLPGAPAWGQAGSQGPGNVTRDQVLGRQDEREPGPRAGKRTRKPNVCFTGAEWK